MARLLMEDAEWAFFQPFLFAIRGRGGRPASDHRLTLDTIFWSGRTGSPWHSAKSTKAGIVMSDRNSLSEIIRDRLDVLGLSRRQLVKRLGYSNINKGFRRLEAILDGDRRTARNFALKLSSALEVDIAEIETAITADCNAALAKLDRQYRESFKPHAVTLTERSIPSPISVSEGRAAWLFTRLLRINFIEGSPPITFVDQSRRNLPKGITACGGVTGFVVNYTPDHAVVFDCGGNLLETRNEAIRVGQASLSVSGRTFSLIQNDSI